MKLLWQRARLTTITLLIAWLGLTVMVGTSACGGNKRQDTLRATLVGLKAARDGFTAWDLSHQKTILEKATSREEAETKIAAYREKQATVIAGFEGAYFMLGLAAAQTDDPSLRSALAKSAELLKMLHTLMGGS